MLGFYDGGEIVGIEGFPEVTRWLAACEARPASQRAINIPARPE